MAWGPWIKHDGKGCPVAGHTVEVMCRWAGETVFASCKTDGGGGSWWWNLVGGVPTCHDGWSAPVIRYRVWRGDAFEKLASIAENPAPAKEREPA